MIGIFVVFALSGQELFQLAGRTFIKFSLLQERLSHKGMAAHLAAGVLKLVDEIFTGIFPHAEIITQTNTLLNTAHTTFSKNPLSPLTL
jgi:hypothetical protein